ncbi:MAG: hypothetical protein U5J64_11220 [Halobacteriales archaeon]|nr:hypothetical protein [Halobacteriales archaeon]
MSKVAPAPHEFDAFLLFDKHGLSPYLGLSREIIHGLDGSAKNYTTFTVDGEEWNVEKIYYKKGNIDPEDMLDFETVYEFHVVCRGDGERKAAFHITPRWSGIESKSGKSIPCPPKVDEGTSVRVQGSNVDPRQYTEILRTVMGELTVSPKYFRSPHAGSRVIQYERYVRIERDTAKKVISLDGALARVWRLLGRRDTGHAEYKKKDEDVEGYEHVVQFDGEGAGELIPGHRIGKYVKHYHPQHVRDDDEDPLYHPKIGVSLNRKLHGSVPYSKVEELERELDESLINLLSWSDVPTEPSSVTYVADDHFAPTERDDIAIYEDPTPKIEMEQDAVVVRTLREGIEESDFQAMEALLSDGGGQHPAEVAADTDYSVRTLYRSLERLDGIVRNDSSTLRFVSKKVAEDVREIVSQTRTKLQTAAERACAMINVDADLDGNGEAFQRWCSKYAVEVARDDDNLTFKIGAMLDRISTSPKPTVYEVLQEGARAWRELGRPGSEFKDALVEAEVSGARGFKGARIRNVMTPGVESV